MSLNRGPSYDAKGNLTAFWGQSYGYSSENLLVTATGTSGLAYDPGMRLYQVNGAAATTRFGYDGSAMIGEYNTSNALQRRYVFGPNADEPLVWYEGSGTTNRRWLHADERGSVTAISDGTGNPIAIDSYDEYGMPATTNIGRFGYTGQAWLGELGTPPNGLSYYKARMYSPRLGRFMQADPAGVTGGLNLYNYAGSDPVNNADPGGTGIEEIFLSFDFSPTIVVFGFQTFNFGLGSFNLSPTSGFSGYPAIGSFNPETNTYTVTALHNCTYYRNCTGTQRAFSISVISTISPYPDVPGLQFVPNVDLAALAPQNSLTCKGTATFSAVGPLPQAAGDVAFASDTKSL